MYKVGRRDSVREIDDLPQSSIGAPNPIVVCDERWTYVVYYVEDSDPEWDGRTTRLVGPDSDEPVAIVKFRTHETRIGPPNDEGLSAHPLYDRGLRPYGFFEVLESSWLRSLGVGATSGFVRKRFNLPEPHRHFIMTFHDSTFECAATSFELVESRIGSGIDAAIDCVKNIASDD